MLRLLAAAAAFLCLAAAKLIFVAVITMEHLPVELLVQIIPDPDTLGRMLRLCKRVSFALTSPGPFKLDDSDQLRVYNGAVTFSMYSELPYMILSRQTACDTVTDRFTSDLLYKRLGMPRYIRVCGDVIITAGGVGWDTVRYKKQTGGVHGSHSRGGDTHIFGVWRRFKR